MPSVLFDVINLLPSISIQDFGQGWILDFLQEIKTAIDDMRDLFFFIISSQF